MSGIQFNIDFSQIKPNEGLAQFPPTTDKLGWLVHIVGSEQRENKNKNGMLAVFKLEGLDGPVKGMVNEKTFNLSNPNQQAVEIAFGEMSAMAHCIGLLRVGNSLEMNGKPFRVLVREQAENPRYTEIYGFLDVNGNPPSKAGQGPLAPQTAPAQGFGQQPTQQAAPASGAPTWGAPAHAQQPSQQPAEAPSGAPTWGAPATGGAPGWAAPR